MHSYSSQRLGSNRSRVVTTPNTSAELGWYESSSKLKCPCYPLDSCKYLQLMTRRISNLNLNLKSLHYEFSSQSEAALPFPGAFSNLTFHFSSCLNKVATSIALGFPCKGSAPPSSNAYSNHWLCFILDQHSTYLDNVSLSFKHSSG